MKSQNRISFFYRDAIVFPDKTKQHFLLPAPIKREILTSREGLYKSRLRDLRLQSIKIKQ